LRAAERAALVVVFALAAGAVLSAHRRDEYLQAARLTVDPARVGVELDMTPGIAVADAVIAAIDRDRDGRFSAGEQRAYVSDVSAAWRVAIDGQRLPLDVTASSFADPDALRRGEGTIRLEASGALPRLAAGNHRLEFQNGYRRDISVYLANALVPVSERVAIAGQARDADQRALTIDYDLGAETAAAPSTWVVALVAGFAVIACQKYQRSRIAAAAGALRARLP
jgi:nickel/cobalt exporter